ncbi:type I restriction enzyme HsdR N-terminal domain-containing protein [Natronosalvus vescus]|uniref:type I restriction enzyme HsdR N-terminal domain-containing protein n=1 Tax=Natronosalvus vescus TaxID=2953881 RepID=UPI00209152B9|nr:type I restriction enzyme HsdR N-terminal domain-containing protein [Natronosalvus vescus]
MNAEEVGEYVERSQQLLEASPRMNEQNTKVRLVQPLLELLGWDLYSTEVELEYTVPMASGSTHVDYALLVGDSPVVFVEAKAASSGLSSHHVTQLKSYMRQELDVDWGILTNGKEFEVLTKDQHSNGGEEVSVVQFDLDDLAESPDVLELLSKEAIRSGKADKIAVQVAQTNEAIRYLNQNESNVAETVSSAVEGELGEVPLDLEEQSRDFVQNLVSALREQRQFVREDRPTENPNPQASPPTEDESDELQPRRNRVVGTISREEIEGDDDATVAVYASRESGLRFLRENAAWGFVRVGKEFDYIAMYISGDVGEVQFFAETDAVVEPSVAGLERDLDEYDIEEGEQVITFKRDSFYELKDPVPFESKYPQSRRDTTLGKLRTATTTDDLF